MPYDSSPALAHHLLQLMRNVQAGDQDAFGQLYDLTSGRVTAVVVRTLHDPDHSAEVVQDVYLYAWQHAHSFDTSRGAVIGWLITLAHHRAVDRVRHVVRSVARDHRSAVEQDHTVPDVAELGLANVDAARLHQALEGLSAKQRQALLLTYVDGWTFAQASERLSVPIGTLKTRARDGLAALRLAYGEATAA